MMGRRCAQDGYTFDGPPTLLPSQRDSKTLVFTFMNLHFCSPSCAKGYLFRDAHCTMDKIHLFHQYAREILGLEDVRVSPDPMFLQDYMVTPGTGKSIEEFRSAPTVEGVCGTRQPGVDPIIDDSIQYTHVKLIRETEAALTVNDTLETLMEED